MVKEPSLIDITLTIDKFLELEIEPECMGRSII